MQALRDHQYGILFLLHKKVNSHFFILACRVRYFCRGYLQLVEKPLERFVGAAQTTRLGGYRAFELVKKLNDLQFDGESVLSF